MVTEVEMSMCAGRFHVAYNMPMFDYPCWCKLPICLWLCLCEHCMSFLHSLLTYHEPRKTRHPSTQLTHRRAPVRQRDTEGFDAPFSVNIEVHEYESEVFQLKWDENMRMRAIKTDRERDGCCVLTITLINLPVLGDAIDWNAIPLRSLISTFLSLLLSACERVYMCLQKKAQLSFFLLEMWICGTAGMGS